MYVIDLCHKILFDNIIFYTMNYITCIIPFRLRKYKKNHRIYVKYIIYDVYII